MRHVVGGICVPALLHFSRNVGSPMQGGMGIPMATDIAFALCVLALLGHLPASLNISLTALAVIDDLGAIIVIALFYTNSMSIGYLAGALVMFGALLCLNRWTPVTALIPPPTPPSNTALKRRALPVKMEQRQLPHVVLNGRLGQFPRP
ncbi:Na+/H+ antiporter NhaA [Janthinobacterium sp. RB2P8]|uniref:Na+/H+ antiporter NhaA n=1 Tax=Janthinobacterium sp. RB2P8 TaxID=3424191 RepID=UPI003F295AD3